MTVIADETTVRTAQRRALAADYARIAALAAAAGERVEIVAVRDGETQSWSVDPNSISVDEVRIAFDAADGRTSVPFVGPDASAVLPMLTRMGAEWRHREAARAQMRRLSFGHAGERMLRIDDGDAREHAPACMVMINGVGIFPPSVQGITWDETRSLHSSGDILTVRDSSRSLSFS